MLGGLDNGAHLLYISYFCLPARGLAPQGVGCGDILSTAFNAGPQSAKTYNRAPFIVLVVPAGFAPALLGYRPRFLSLEDGTKSIQ